MVNGLAVQLVTLPGPYTWLVVIGVAVLFSLGCNLVYKGRMWYILPVLSSLVGYLFLQGLVLSEEITEEWARQLMYILPVMAVPVLVLGAFILGEDDIKRHQLGKGGVGE